MTKEKRRTTRVKFHTSVDLKFVDKLYEQCEILDLSVKGVFVLGVTNCEPGQECEVTLQLSGVSSELKLKMKAKVARVTKDGIGLNFHEVDLDSFSHLKYIVYYNSENPDLLDENYLEPVPEGEFT
jgi:hypothetical protein